MNSTNLTSSSSENEHSEKNPSQKTTSKKSKNQLPPMRFEGIFDLRTLKFLKSLGHHHFTFDMRPQSFNFMPLHRLISILENVMLGFLQDPQGSPDKFYFQFEREKEFVITKICQDLTESFQTLQSKERGSIWGKNFFLEFFDGPEFQVKDQNIQLSPKAPNFNPGPFDHFQKSYYWHYQEGSPLKEIFKGQHLKGIVLDLKFLNEQIKNKVLNQFCRQLLHLSYEFSSQRQHKDLEFILSADFEEHNLANLQSLGTTWELVELMDLTLISFRINQSTQICYRNVDLNLLEEKINSIIHQMN
jgi:hypothetical protein